MFGNTGPFSYAPGGFSPGEFQQQRRGFQQNDYGGAAPQANMSRPSSRSIYMQRKEYLEALNRQPDSVQARVEHLFTCEMDGRDIKTVNDCVAKLKTLDAKGRLWPQEMILEIQGGYLLLSDIETKAELEALPLHSVQQTMAVLDSCDYNSILAVTVRDGSKRFPQVFMFQCEETGAEVLKKDMDKVFQRGPMEPQREQPDVRSNLGNLWQRPSIRQAAPVQQERPPPPQDHPAPQWGSREQENTSPLPRFYAPQEEPVQPLNLPEFPNNRDPDPSPMLSDTERNTEILNHVLNDMETFMGKISAAMNAPAPQTGKSKNKFRMPKQKKKQVSPVVTLPPWEEYVSCLQKIKYGFNLLGQLNGLLNAPTAPDFVHIFFRSLGMMLPQYPPDLPPTVLAPLLTEAALQLLSEVVSPEEDQLWRSLGDCWNIPRSRWPDDNVPPYIPEFYDGWQPPAPRHSPPPPPYHSSPAVSRSNSQRFPMGRPGGNMDDRGMQPKEPMNAPWGSPPPTRPTEPPLYMRVMYNFLARNSKELSVMKGEEVEVIQKSRQWWLVRNSRGEQGSIPQNVLESIDSSASMEDEMDTRGPTRLPMTLDMSSTSAQVRAWLEYKGFAKMTVTSLGVLNGKLLLGMTRDEIRTVCPEEGARVFFQLQSVKSAIALASEPSGQYNGQY